MKLLNKVIECKIEKLVNGGFGLGHYQNKVVFIYNSLPGELVHANVYKDKKGYSEAIATNILNASENRIDPQEDHFLSCSPWQIMNFSEENRWKVEITKEVFASISDIFFESINLNFGEDRFHYRNKMEYSFDFKNEKLSLAFFKRGTKDREAIHDCVLAKPNINKYALQIVNELNTLPVGLNNIKSMIVRCNRFGNVTATIFVKNDHFPKISNHLLNDEFQGMSVVYSDPKSPVSVSTQVLQESGDLSISEKINGKLLKFGTLSFFQVNVDLFEKAVKSMQHYLEGEEILDYFCGVGAIGIALNDVVKNCIMVDSNQEAIEYAKLNIETNQLDNYEAFCEKAELLVDYIVADKVLIIDPPRAGVHNKVIHAIRNKLPKRIIYLSCNISTCARDVGMLKDYYTILHQEIFNFFPATPHIEVLVILERK